MDFNNKNDNFTMQTNKESDGTSKKRTKKILLIIAASIFWLIILIVLNKAAPVLFDAVVKFLILSPAVAWLIFKLYEPFYFKGKRFLEIKSKASQYIADANELNHHIEDLKDTELVDNRLNCGEATYEDASKWNMSRTQLSGSKYAPFKYDCSRQVCDGARKEPFKYICKYFNIKADEETLAKFEEILNNFEAVEDGKTLIKAQRDSILSNASVPLFIRIFSKKRLINELGFEPVDFSTIYFPHYIFQYTSSGGNASTLCDVVMDINNLNRFVVYLAEKIRFQKSAAGQRALMTSKLRQKIKERDHFTCCTCGVSIYQEPHLLLEIDHIVPVSKGGGTAENNLQTLCWRCNRTKGAKI